MDTLKSLIDNLSFNDYIEHILFKFNFGESYRFKYKKYHMKEWLTIFMDFYKYRTVLKIYDNIDIFENRNEIELVYI